MSKTLAALRQRMTELHTWAGILFGGLLFFIFFMGSIAVFDTELDSWMEPALRIEGDPARAVSVDAALLAAAPLLQGASDIFISLPDERSAAIRLFARVESGKPRQLVFDPVNATLLPEPRTLGASRFFYPLHYSLLLGKIGDWIVGIAAMTMLLLLTSGVIIHKKIFTDFFTFRLQKSRQRSLLDLHNVSSVLLLPFHFVIALSGLIIFTSIFMPAGVVSIYKKPADFIAQAFDEIELPATGEPAPLASIDTMLQRAQALWGQGRVTRLEIHNYGDRNALIEMHRDSDRRINIGGEPLSFAGVDGAFLRRANAPAASIDTWQFIEGLHLVRFSSWPLFWGYFLMGICSCAMIATGLLVWLEKRAQRSGHSVGFRCAQCMALGSTVGLACATAAMLAANRLLPSLMPQRAAAEVWCFFAAWIFTFVCAWWLPGIRGLRAQLRWLGVGALLLPLLNGATTGDHLIKTLIYGNWTLASIDAVFIVIGSLALFAARRLRVANERHASDMSKVGAAC